MANKKISELVERTVLETTDVIPVVASGATETNKTLLSTLLAWMQTNLIGKFNTPTGTASQYIRGDGELATFPTSTGGGSSVAYYLNGSINADVSGYKQMSGTAVVGVNADFTLNADGVIAEFMTDAGNPNLVEIKAGNWNLELYFSASSSGGTPKYYVSLLKYDGSTFTPIASGIAAQKPITSGTNIDLYLSSLAIPLTTLSITDRLVVRVNVIHSGRTITLHTQNGHLCEIITNFASGVSSINGVTKQTQYLAVGQAGSDFNIDSQDAGGIHYFNLPTASSVNRGALSAADWNLFYNKQSALGFTPVTQGRTITINSVTYDLSANRSWSITSVAYATAAGYADNCQDAVYASDAGYASDAASAYYWNGLDAYYIVSASPYSSNVDSLVGWNFATNSLTKFDSAAVKLFLGLGSAITGSGSSGYIAKFNGSDSLTNSLLYDGGTKIGLGNSMPLARFDIADTSMGTTKQLLGLGESGSISNNNGSIIESNSMTGMFSMFNYNAYMKSMNPVLSWSRINGNVSIGSTSSAYPLYVATQVSNISIYAVYDIVAFSDESIKENIRPIENVLDRVIKSRGILYDRIDNGSKDNIGFIAQELEVQFPELVVENEDGTKAVKYQNAVAVLFEAIKEQQKQIEDLKELVNKLIAK